MSMTAEEFLRLPSGSQPTELMNGEVVELEFGGGLHGMIGARLACRLATFVESHHLGAVLPRTGFIISRSPDTVLAPDIAYVANSPTTIPDSFIPGAPDLAVEVLSFNETRREVEARMLTWQSAGARLGWLIDPDRQTVAVYAAASPVRLLRVEDEISGEDVLPGFACKLADIFKQPKR